MPFKVTLANEDREFTCAPGQSVLDAALQQNIMLSYGCRNGLCGSCKGELLAGSIEYPEGKPGGIDDGEIEQGHALFCKAVPQSDLTIKVHVIEDRPDIEVKTLPVKVTEISYLADDVVRLILQLPAVETFNFRAGQWVYFVLKDGRKRAFSIANAPNERNELELQIRHAVGGVFTDYVFNQLTTGALLRIEGPHGSFFHHRDERPILLVAGGTGFAPIKGIFEEMSAGGLTQTVHLFWGSRSKQDLYQEELVQQWVQQHAIRYTPVLSDAEPGDDWQGATGFVHQAVIEVYPEMRPYAVYMAGPPQMISSCRDAFLDAGLDEARLYFDSFDYSSDALDAMQGG